MHSLTTAIVVFGCVFGGALLGMHVRERLPEHHLSDQSATVVKLGMGLMGTMAAMLLSLQLGTAKASFDTLSNELTQMSANVVLLDRVLSIYGVEAQPARQVLKRNAMRIMELISGPTVKVVGSGGDESNALYDAIQALSPGTEAQRTAKSRALDVAFSLGQTRWLMIAQQSSGVSKPLIVILVSWLTMIFVSFGLFAPRNATVLAALAACGASVAGAIFLMIELYAPISGMIRISSAPLRAALSVLGH